MPADPRCEFVETSDALYKLMNLNFRSVFAACRAAIPRFRAQGAARSSNHAARHGGGPALCTRPPRPR